MLARRPGKTLTITFAAFAALAIIGLILVAAVSSMVGAYVMFAGVIGFIVTGVIIFVTVPRT